MKPHPSSRNNQKLREKAFSPLNIAKRFDPLALWITRRVGTMSFFGIILFWTLLWLIWNTLAPPPWRFDPCPTFALWLFISNMMQIFLMPLLMIGQNLEARSSEAKAEAHFAISIKTEQEMEQILKLLDYQNQLLHDLLELYETEHRETQSPIIQIHPPRAKLRHENAFCSAKKQA